MEFLAKRIEWVVFNVYETRFKNRNYSFLFFFIALAYISFTRTLAVDERVVTVHTHTHTSTRDFGFPRKNREYLMHTDSYGPIPDTAATAAAYAKFTLIRFGFTVRAWYSLPSQSVYATLSLFNIMISWLMGNFGRMHDSSWMYFISRRPVGSNMNEFDQQNSSHSHLTFQRRKQYA